MTATTKMTNTHKADFPAMFLEAHNTYEGCGICERKGNEVFWFSPYSSCAHAKCVQSLHSAENTLISTINELFKREDHFAYHNMAHFMAIRAVKQKLGPGSLEQHLQRLGEKEIAFYFEWFGVEAAKKFAKTMGAKV